MDELKHLYTAHIPKYTSRYTSTVLNTDKKENIIFLIFKEIHNGAVAKSYMTDGILIYGKIFAPFLIY
jgi:hypothetical protein